MKFCDSHAHLTCEAVYPHLSDILKRAFAAHVETVINICTDSFSLEKGIKLAEDVKQVYTVGATTPHDVTADGEKDFSLFETAAKEGKLIAIGETGLDYFYEHSPKKLQQSFLIRYLQLAIKYNLPVVIHCREAFADLFAITEEYFSHRHLVLHCFTGTIKEAEKALEKGYFISFSGIVTFKKSEELRKVAEMVPLDHLLIETDTPYLAPQSKRGTSNEPSFLLETAQTIADVKRLPLETVAEQTRQNALNFFQIA